MTDGRMRVAGAAALSSLFFIGTIAPAAAAPSWDEAQQRADALGTTAERLGQNQAQLTSRLQGNRTELRRVEQQLKDARADGREARRDLVELVVDDVASGGDQVAADVLASRGLVDIDLVAESDAELVVRERRADRAVERLTERQDELRRAVLRLDTARDKQQPRVETARQRADQAAALVEQMREERASRAAEREEQAVAATGGASAVVDYAMAQVGDAYVYGASGPDAFDCSGLTSAAWAQAGVTLPRTSSAQMSAGTPVSTDALQPGDLVFYYSPVSHVGIYIGNGQIVHAANPSTDVQVAPLHMMPLVGAVRPG